MTFDQDRSDDDIPRILYVVIEERVEGFRWQVRAHNLDGPIEVGLEVFASDAEARAAGRAALDQVCREFARYIARE